MLGFKYFWGPPKPKTRQRQGGGSRPKRNPDGTYAGSTGGGGSRTAGARRTATRAARSTGRRAARGVNRHTKRLPSYSIWGSGSGRRRRGGRRRKGWF